MEEIEGIKLINLKKITNDRGFLQEVIRTDDPFFTKFGQVYFTFTNNNITKAWYKHTAQTDYIFVVKGTMKIGLFDQRKNTATFGHKCIYHISAEKPQLIKIPPGIWHGFKAINSDLMLLHVNSEAINFEHTDEEKLDINTKKIPLKL